jgi:HlyD family secretion protein
MQSESAFFYGFAENKETELNLDVDCLITKVHVSPGEEVLAGQILLEAKQTKFDMKINALDFNIKEQSIRTKEEKLKLENEIAVLQIKLRTVVQDLDAKIKTLESKIGLNDKLLDQISSMDIPNKNNRNTVAHIELQELKNKRSEVERPIKEQINLLNSQLAKVGSAERLQTQRFNSEKEMVNKEMEKLSIYAPTDGLIGNVHCIDGENVSAFNTLISFYERNPTLVKGFVHEKLILEVKLGDKLSVTSNQHPNHIVYGKVAGLGTRIVEIPERLRKIADFKTYGREVLIRIPADNPFLQKEKVTLNSATKEDKSFFSNLLN